MNTPTISRLSPEDSAKFRRTTPQPQPTRIHKSIEWALFAIFAVITVLVGLAMYSAYSPSHKSVPNHFADGVKSDRINILVIGVGGELHPGGGRDLADSILLVSLRPSTKQAAIVSIPRDLYVKIGPYGRHRINRAHAIGDSTGYPGAGPALLMSTVEQNFGLPVHAYVRVDFAAFKKIIDDLGGIDIYVQRPFYDYLFKDGFQAGWQHMDGERALRYARYRYVIGPEGDNFARELRQQQVVRAVRTKLQKRSAVDMVRLLRSAQTISDDASTNLTATQIAWLYSHFHDTGPDRIRNVSLKPYMEEFDLKTFSEPGEAVRPRGGDFAQVRSLMQGIFSEMREVATPDEIRLADSMASGQ